MESKPRLMRYRGLRGEIHANPFAHHAADLRIDLRAHLLGSDDAAHSRALQSGNPGRSGHHSRDPGDRAGFAAGWRT